MKLLLRSLKPTGYLSTLNYQSKTIPGVAFTIRRMSLGRRIELAEAIRDMALELEFQQAGVSPKERVDAAVLAARIERVYLRWGLTAIRGLRIDGGPATAESLFSDGPENLLREIVEQIKRECGLTDDDRKN